MRALVLGGAGAVCRQTTKDLSRFSRFDEIVVADYNLEAVNKLIHSINDERLKPLLFNAHDFEGMLQLFPQFDVVVNGLPFEFDLAVNKACVQVGVSGLDLSSEDPQFQLHQQAIQKDMLFVPGVGATPGITNMMVRRATEVLDSVSEVEIYFAAFRCLAPAPGLLETTLWEFNPEEEDRDSVYFEDGRWLPAAPLSGEKVVHFHPQIGSQKVYYVPHDEVYTLPQSLPNLRRVAVKGCFPPHVMHIMGALMQSGLLSKRPVKLGDLEMASIDAIRVLLAASEFSKENDNWGYGLVVEVVGERHNRQVMCTYRSHHPPQEVWGNEGAYYKNVGIPLSIGAQLIADGKVNARGVLPPEMAFPARPFFEALALRGITIEEQIVETGQLC
jgi:lysine 6-dehydrogenase